MKCFGGSFIILPSASYHGLWSICGNEFLSKYTYLKCFPFLANTMFASLSLWKLKAIQLRIKTAGKKHRCQEIAYWPFPKLRLFEKTPAAKTFIPTSIGEMSLVFNCALDDESTNSHSVRIEPKELVHTCVPAEISIVSNFPAKSQNPPIDSLPVQRRRGLTRRVSSWG